MNTQEKLRAALVEQLGQMMLALIESRVEIAALEENLAQTQASSEA